MRIKESKKNRKLCIDISLISPESKIQILRTLLCKGGRNVTRFFTAVHPLNCFYIRVNSHARWDTK